MRMMMVAGALGLLAGCGGPTVDDPANIPKLGLWTKEIKMGSVVVDGLTLDADELPKGAFDSFGTLESAESKARCIEPLARNRDDVLQHIESRFARDCAFPETLATRGHLSMKSQCESKNKDGPSAILVESAAASDALTITSRISVPMKNESGSTNRVEVSQYVKYRRAGDCG